MLTLVAALAVVHAAPPVTVLMPAGRAMNVAASAIPHKRLDLRMLGFSWGAAFAARCRRLGPSQRAGGRSCSAFVIGSAGALVAPRGGGSAGSGAGLPK